MLRIVSFFRFLVRIKESINCFRDLPTFNLSFLKLDIFPNFVAFSEYLNFSSTKYLFSNLAQDSEFCSFFGRIKETINCFRDLLTFNLSFLQVNKYEIVINFFHYSHNLTWYSAIVHKFTRIYPVCSTSIHINLCKKLHNQSQKE